MISRRHTAFAFTLVSLAFAPCASALVEFARGNLIASANLTEEFDSNVFGNNTELSDSITTFSPALNFSRKAGLISANLGAGINIVRFKDFDTQDSENPFFNFGINYDNPARLNLKYNGSYNRISTASDAALDRTESDQFTLGVVLNYAHSDKLSTRAGVNYRSSFDKTSNSNAFADTASYAFTAGSVYKYSPKLSGALAYTFRPSTATRVATNANLNPDAQDHQVAFSLEGELAPKVTGVTSVGYTLREFKAGGSEDAITFGVGTTWAAAQKTSVTLNASQDFSTTETAESITGLNIRLGLNQQLLAKLSANLYADYATVDYSTPGQLTSRSDDNLTYTAGLIYAFNEFLSSKLGYSYRDNNSNIATASYTRAIVTVGFTARY
jgi:hypothetical protein